MELYYDGACRFCSREMAALERLDRGRGLIAFLDISDAAFDAAAIGRSDEDLMARIHARLPDGSWVDGMEVFRRAYAAVGRGWLLAPTGWPLLRPLVDAGYRWFARNRLWLGGRCESDHCALPSPNRKEPSGSAE